MELRDIALQLIGLLLTVWVAVLAIRRKVHRVFPLFVTYLALAIVVPVVRLSVSGNYTVFFYTFWTTEGLYALFALFALYEVFRKIFFAFYELWWWFRLVFPAAVCLAILISTRRMILNPPVEAPPLLGVIISGSRIVNYLEAMLFGLFFVLALLLGIRRRSYPFGIVEGFGIAAAAALVAYGLRSEFGTKFNSFVRYVPAVAYELGALVWLDTFRRPPDPEVIHAWKEQVTPEQMLVQAREWIRVMKRPFKRNDL
jgi:hypothetical protein